jgi:hypothetical protein
MGESNPFLSAEWNATCGMRPISLRGEVSAAVIGVSWFFIIVEILFVPTTLVAFALLKSKYIYLKKRSYLAILLMGLNTVFPVFLGPVRDIIGAQTYSCDFQNWGRALAGMFISFYPLHMLRDK